MKQNEEFKNGDVVRVKNVSDRSCEIKRYYVGKNPLSDISPYITMSTGGNVEKWRYCRKHDLRPDIKRDTPIFVWDHERRYAVLRCFCAHSVSEDGAHVYSKGRSSNSTSFTTYYLNYSLTDPNKEDRK